MPLQEPRLYTLNDVLHDRIFRVPPYQRGYSWTTLERSALFQDLRNLRELQRAEHFMATLVFLDTGMHELIGGADRLSIYDVVDGQQRLTTLIILLKAIEKNLRKNAQKAQAEKIEAILVKEQKDLVLLQTNHDARDTLDDYLRKGNIGYVDNANTMHQRELMRAFRECEQFVTDWGNPVALLDALKNPRSISRGPASPSRLSRKASAPARGCSPFIASPEKGSPIAAESFGCVGKVDV